MLAATRVIFVLFLPWRVSQSFQLTQQGREFVTKSGSSNAAVSRAAHQGLGRDGWALFSSDTYSQGAKKVQS